MKKPNFFIIGAPKCATTSLARWLDQHESVFFSIPKEPAFFNDSSVTIKTLKQYETLYKKANKSHIAVGEGTTHYFYSDTAIKKILDYSPKAKFILCLRNPIDMAVSMHSERLYQGDEAIKSFEEVWKKDISERGMRRVSLFQNKFSHLTYKELCSHGYWLQRLLKIVDRDQLHIILFDDLKKDAKKVFSEVLSFLGLPPNDEIKLLKHNTAKQIKSIWISRLIKWGVYIKKKIFGKYRTNIASFLRNMNTYKEKNEQISSELYQEMLNYFLEDIILLESLINKDLSEWKE